MQSTTWNSKNGGKYHEEALQQSPNYIEAKDWNLLLLKSNKLYPNILDVRNQLKTLSIREREEIFEISKRCAENEASEINEKLAAPANKENLEARSTQRHCKLKDSQRLAILNLHFMKNLSRARISDKLGVPYTTVSRIIRNFNTFPSSTKAWFEYKEMEVSESPRIAQAIKNYIKNTKTIFNSASVAKFVKQELNISVWKRSIAKFLKRELRMSYRKVSSRPTNTGSMVNQMLKSVFWIEFSNLVDRSNVYVNIDEVLFSNSTKVTILGAKEGGTT